MAAKSHPNQVIFVVDGSRSPDLYYAMTVLDRGDTFEIVNRVWNGRDFVWQNLARTNEVSVDIARAKGELEHRGFLKRLFGIPARYKVLGIIDITYEKLGLVFFREENDDKGAKIHKSLIKPV